jgi:hypothetical protein
MPISGERVDQTRVDGLFKTMHFPALPDCRKYSVDVVNDVIDAHSWKNRTKSSLLTHMNAASYERQ